MLHLLVAGGKHSICGDERCGGAGGDVVGLRFPFGVRSYMWPRDVRLGSGVGFRCELLHFVLELL